MPIVGFGLNKVSENLSVKMLMSFNEILKRSSKEKTVQINQIANQETIWIRKGGLSHNVASFLFIRSKEVQ